MADQSIFDSNNQTQATPVSPQPTTSPSDELVDLLSQIRNENGEPKYKTVKDALVGLQHAQSFIQTLKTEKSQIEQQVNELRPVADKVSELEKVVLQLSSTPPAASTNAPALSEEAVAQLVENTLSKKQQEQVAKQNLESVAASVKQAFGDKAEEVFYAKAQEIGLSRAEINALAARTPQAALKLVGLNGSSPAVPKPTTSSVNASAFQPAQDTFISRNAKRLEVGATASELMEETLASKRMVQELNERGMSIDDLTKPSNYFKYFK